MKPIRMQCYNEKACGDETCKHREEHDMNLGCEYHCHFSDFTLMCRPTAKGWTWFTDRVRIYTHKLIQSYRRG